MPCYATVNPRTLILSGDIAALASISGNVFPLKVIAFELFPDDCLPPEAEEDPLPPPGPSNPVSNPGKADPGGPGGDQPDGYLIVLLGDPFLLYTSDLADE